MILTAFKSNLCQIIQNLAKKMLNVKPTAAHHLIASQIQTIYQMIRKHPQNGNLKGISTLLLAVWPIGNTYDTVLAAVEERYFKFTNCSCSTVPASVHSKENFHNSAAEPNRELLKLPILGYVQA